MAEYGKASEIPYNEAIKWFNALEYVKAGENCNRAIAASPAKGVVDDWQQKWQEGMRLNDPPSEGGMEGFWDFLRANAAKLPRGTVLGPDGTPVIPND